MGGDSILSESRLLYKIGVAEVGEASGIGGLDVENMSNKKMASH